VHYLWFKVVYLSYACSNVITITKELVNYTNLTINKAILLFYNCLGAWFLGVTQRQLGIQVAKISASIYNGQVH